MDLLDKIKATAKLHNKKIVLPESTEERTLEAANILLGEGIAQIILIGDKREILDIANDKGLKNIENAIFVNPKNHNKKDDYIDLMLEIRKKKGLTRDEASVLIEDPLYLSTLMIKAGDADGEVAGAENATGDVLRPAFQYVKTMPGISVVSGAFIMILKDKQFGVIGGPCTTVVAPFILTRMKKNWQKLL